MSNHLRLGVNIDHVATIRNARGGDHPDPVRAAFAAAKAGADGITAHLREDRRHIRDEDIAELMANLKIPLNLEMAATEEMLEIALRHRPHAGHGLTFDNVAPIAAIPQLAELNIGHFLVGEAIFTGFEASVARMRALMDEARG